MRAVAKSLTVTAASAAIFTLAVISGTGGLTTPARAAATTKLEHPKKVIAGQSKGNKFLVRVTVRIPSGTFSATTDVKFSDPSSLLDYKLSKKSVHKTGDNDLLTVLLEVTTHRDAPKKKTMLDIGTGLLIITTTMPDATTDPMLVIPDPVYDPCDGC